MKGLSFDKFITERAESGGHKEAMKLGLEYKGGGYWNDPKTNKITHQTVDGELQPYEGAAAPMSDAGGAVNPATLADKNPQQPGGQMAPPLGSGVGPAPEPGEETPNPMGANWSPGPDGDNCVEGQPAPDDLSFDMFVGKTNYYKWVAGSDGSNFKNLDFTKFTKDEEEKVEETIAHSYFTFLGEEELDVGNPTAVSLGGMSPAEKAAQMGLISNGNGSYRDKSGITVARTVNGELMFYDQGPGGGAVSDGAGGEQQATNQPSWQDPTTGQLMTPPAQPESPEEIAAVPDPIPATPPTGYDSFMNQKADQKRRDQIIQDEIDGKKAATDEKYAEAPLGKAFSARMDMFIDDMVNSDDEEEKGIGYHLMDVMADNVDTHVKALQSIRDDMKPGAVATLARMAEREARIRYLRDQEPEQEEPEKIEGETDTSISSQLEDDEDNEVEQVENPELQKALDQQKEEAGKFEKDFDTTVDEYLDSLGPRKKKEVSEFMSSMRESLKSIPSDTTRKSYRKAVASAYTYTGRVNSGSGKNDLGFVDIQTLNSNKDRLLKGYGDGSPEEVFKFVKSVRNEKVDDQFFESSFATLPMKLKEALGKKGLVTADKYERDDKADKDLHYLGEDEDGNEVRGDLVSKENKDMRARLMWRIYLEQGGVDAYTGLPLVLEAMDLEHVVGFNNSTNGAPGREQWKQRENNKNFVMINSNINQKKSDLSMPEFYESQVDPLKDNTEAQFGGVKNMRDKQNQIKTQNTERAQTLCTPKKGPSGYNEMTDDTTSDALKGYFDQDDSTHASLRSEFKEVASNDKEKKQAAGIKANMGGRLVKAMGLKRSVTDPSGRRRTEPAENVYRGFLLSMSSASPNDRKKYYKGWEQALKTANEERSQKALCRSLKEQGLITDEILNDKKLGKVFKEDYIHDDEMYLLEDMKSFSVFMRKLNIKKGI